MKSFLLLFFILSVTFNCFGQGKYAGAHTNLIGVTYEDSKNIPALKDWEFQSGRVRSKKCFQRLATIYHFMSTK